MSAAIIEGPRADTATAWWFLDLLVVEHQFADDTGTVVLEMTLPAGSAAPLHVHDLLDDTWFVLDGEMVVQCGDDLTVVGPGHWLSLPRGVPHSFRVVSEQGARILLVHDNSTFRDFVRALGVPAEQLSVPPQPVFPSPEDLARAGATHHLTPVGPPMSDEQAGAVLTAR